MLEQAMVSVAVVFSTRRGELAELVTRAGSSGEGGGAMAGGAKGGAAGGGGGGGGGRGAVGPGRVLVGSLDDFDGIVVIGGDGTFFEV